MNNLVTVSTGDSTKTCTECGRIFRPPHNGHKSVCPDCIRLIKLGVLQPSWEERGQQ